MNRAFRLRAPAAILLDLDGTLVDSVPDLAAGVDHMLIALGRAPAGEARVRDWVGNGVARLVHRALTGTMETDAPPADFERGLERFMVHYGAHATDRSRLYPGVAETLDALAARGFPLGCVTNKPARFTRVVLEDLGLARHFAVVVSGDEVTRGKPHPDAVERAAATLHVRAADCLVVGDSDNDVRAARACGAGIVAVSYGYNHGRDIAASAPDAVIDDLRELLALLAAPCD